MKKITILVLHLGYGGIEKCISNLVNSLVDQYQISIISTYQLYDHTPYPIDQKIPIKYLIKDDIAIRVNSYKRSLFHFHWVQLWKDLYHDYLKKGRFISLIKDSIHSITIVRKKKKLMIDAIKKCDSDIIISTRDIYNLWLSKYGKEGVTKIGWEHNHHHGNQKYIHKIVQSVYGLDYFVLVSKDLTKFYSEKLKNSKVQCVYIPNSIDYFPKTKAKLETENLISIGRLSEEKGYLDLISIFKEIYQRYPNSRLNIIGDGPDRKKIEKKIQSENLSHVIHLHGFQDKQYINKILKKSSVYMMTSYTESFGIVLLEAFSFGIPCVAFDSAEGANEIISNNWDGYLIANRNQEKMVKRVCELLSNHNRRLIMGANGQKKSRQFDIEKTKQRWLELLK